MRHTSTIEYALLALVVICAGGALLAYVWPVFEIILGRVDVINNALAGTK